MGKTVTACRTCWSCQRTDVNLADDLRNFEQLREACGWVKDHQVLQPRHVQELTKMKEEGKLKTETRRLEKLDEEEKEKCKQLLKNENKKWEKLEEEQRKEREKKEKED